MPLPHQHTQGPPLRSRLRRLPIIRSLWPIIRPAWWELQRKIHPAGREVLLNGNIRLRVDPAVNLSHPYNPNYERDCLGRFLSFTTPGATVFDVGANQGLYTVAAGKAVGERGKVVAVECAPAAQLILMRQVRNNNLGAVVMLVAAAAGSNEVGLSNFHPAEHAAGWASSIATNGNGLSMSVVAVTLDSLARSFGTPTVVKIDVEGMEHEVLRGAEAILREHRAVVFCALHPALLAKVESSPATIIRWMNERGYRAESIVGAPLHDAGDEVVIFRPDEEN